MQELYLNASAHVRFQDGTGGTLHKVVLDPHTHRITDLVVVTGFWQRQERVLPVWVVEQASADEIQVGLFVQELSDYPPYQEVEIEQTLDDWDSPLAYPREHVAYWYPPVGIYVEERAVLPAIRRRVAKGVHFGEVALGRSTVVRNLHGVVGKIDHLWLDRQTWEVTHLVVRKGLIPHLLVIPYSWIEAIAEDVVYIWGTDEQLQEAPMLHWHVEHRGDSAVDTGEIEHLDERLSIAEGVLAELANDPRTASSVIEAVYECGVLTLTGEVENELAHVAAEEIAHRHERVMSVVNALEVRPKEDAVARMTRELGEMMVHTYGIGEAFDRIKAGLEDAIEYARATSGADPHETISQ
ncbi:MAG TPA: BON domain-containing protein [Caldilineaceae bacterium]|nr:BON domain-containing protein [Caldilineaceae bacterium]